jgi:hypothetical protein
MDITPKNERENYKNMGVALKAYQKCGGLLDMSPDELKYMPKEVMIACASDEIAYVWYKLPKHLKNDADIKKYEYCTEHQDLRSAPGEDVIDGPPPRRLFCCYCQIKDVKIKNENVGHMSNINSHMGTSKENRRRLFRCPKFCNQQ